MKTFRQFINERKEYLYHGTFGKYMPDIVKKGLLPGNQVHHNNWPGFSKKDKVYLIRDPDKAKEWIQHASASKSPFSKKSRSLRVLRILKSRLNKKKLIKDRNQIPDAYEYSGAIQSRAIDWTGKNLHGSTKDLS